MDDDNLDVRYWIPTESTISTNGLNGFGNFTGFNNTTNGMYMPSTTEASNMRYGMPTSIFLMYVFLMRFDKLFHGP